MKKIETTISRSLISLLVFLSFFSPICTQSLVLDWKVETDGKIVASPVANDHLVFLGNEKGVFMAFKIETGELAWKVETGGNIQAKALLFNDLVFFESANIFYALQQDTGKEIWNYPLKASPEKFSYSGKEYLYKLDPFDDKRSSGYLYNGRVYVGSANGKIVGLRATTGDLEFSIQANDNAPIRSSPIIENDKLYFGDWNGIVYCYDLQQEQFRWTKNTYRDKPYATFGGIASEFCLYKGMLFFGARNPMMNVLWMDDGQKEWTFTDPDGGWMIGDPVIFQDTLYIGGSDNFSMLAFNPSVGKLIWKTKRSRNIYGKPIVTQDWVIYGGGHSYDPKASGELVVLKRLDGKTISSFETTSSVFSSPILIEDEMIIAGSIDGTVYAVSIEK